jgi:hypothetical protein
MAHGAISRTATRLAVGVEVNIVIDEWGYTHASLLTLKAYPPST